MGNTTGFRSDRDGIFIEKSDSGVLAYTLDYTDWLSTDTIATSSWAISTISGDSTPLAADSNSKTTTKTTVVLSAGTVGNIYTATNTIVTAGGYTEERHFRVVVKNRSVQGDDNDG